MAKKNRRVTELKSSLDLVISIEAVICKLLVAGEGSSRLAADRIVEIVDTYIKSGELPADKPWQAFKPKGE